MKKLPNIVILATGGTIAGIAGSTTTTVGYTSAALTVESLIKMVPEIESIANITGHQVVQISSQDMNNDIWLALGKRVNELLSDPDVDGVIITHGTDTMEETAYYLHLVVNSEKPVVLVGAMRPSTAMSADGPSNLYDAVVLAGSENARKKGVLIVMNDTIYSAREVTKSSTFLTDAFQAPGSGALGYIQSNVAHFFKEPIGVHTEKSRFNSVEIKELPKIDIAYGYANVTRAAIDAFVSEGSKGIVYAGTGNGSLTHDVTEALIDARRAGVIVVRSSRVGSGLVARNGEVNDDELDFVVSNTLNPQKARVLLLLALTQTTDTKEIQQIFYDY